MTNENFADNFINIVLLGGLRGAKDETVLAEFAAGAADGNFARHDENRRFKVFGRNRLENAKRRDGFGDTHQF